jgi:hypothetical protein
VSGDIEDTFSFRCGPRERSGAIRNLLDLFRTADDTWLFLQPDDPITDRREPVVTAAGLRIPGWWLVCFGLLVVLMGGYLLSHFIRIGPHMAVAYLWSGGLVVVGVVNAAVGIWVLRQGSAAPRSGR